MSRTEAEIDLGIAIIISPNWIERRAAVTEVGRGGGIAARQRVIGVLNLDLAAVPMATLHEELTVPAVKRQTQFKPHMGDYGSANAAIGRKPVRCRDQRCG